MIRGQRIPDDQLAADAERAELVLDLLEARDLIRRAEHSALRTLFGCDFAACPWCDRITCLIPPDELTPVQRAEFAALAGHAGNCPAFGVRP